MPEGDTVFRTAQTLRSALEGQTVREMQTRVPRIRRLGGTRLVGQVLEEIEPRGKHLLMWFSPSGWALHSHMRMTGSWHLYRPDERWRKPERLVTLRLDVDDWTAVAFSVPVCELLTADQVTAHPGIAGLGPDPLAPHTDLAEALRRLDERGKTTIGEALLDQRVLAGVGNVYKSEVLFLHGVHPWTPVRHVAPQERDRLLASAARLLRQNARSASPMRVTTGAPKARRSEALWVYGRSRRPCRRCATPIVVGRQGEQARVTYWCPACQPVAS
jgi:endonuclease-8